MCSPHLWRSCCMLWVQLSSSCLCLWRAVIRVWLLARRLPMHATGPCPARLQLASCATCLLPLRRIW